MSVGDFWIAEGGKMLSPLWQGKRTLDEFLDEPVLIFSMSIGLPLAQIMDFFSTVTRPPI
jgi:hypothetical protein